MSAPQDVPRAAGRRPLVPSLGGSRTLRVIGLGGVGGVVARYAAPFLEHLSEPSRLVLIDGDDFEPRNAERMIFRAAGNKAEVVAQDLSETLSGDSLDLAAVPAYVGPHNLPRLVREGDIVLLAVDNHATRRLVDQHCAGLSNVVLISGGNDGIEHGRRGTYGNVQVAWRRDGAWRTPSLSRFHPEIAHPADRVPSEASCQELVASVPQILFTNLAVASAMLSTLWLVLCDALHYPEAALDVHDALMRPVPLAPVLPGQAD